MSPRSRTSSIVVVVFGLLRSSPLSSRARMRSLFALTGSAGSASRTTSVGHVEVRLQLRFIEEQGRPAAIEAVHLAVGGQFLLDLAGEVFVQVEQIANGVGILGAVQPPHRRATAGALRPLLGVAQFLIDPFDDGERFLGIGLGLRSSASCRG